MDRHQPACPIDDGGSQVVGDRLRVAVGNAWIESADVLVDLRFTDQIRVIEATPTGVRVWFSVRGGADAVIQVYDVLGRAIGSASVRGFGETHVPCAGVQSGKLFVRLARDGETLATGRVSVLQ